MKLKAILTGLTLLILPLTFVLATSYLKEARGPYWLGTNSDPDFMYLGGALSLSKLSSPAFADHPGTPVISLGALVIITAQAVQQKADLQEDVLKNPEFYLDLIFYTLLVLRAAMLVVAGGITIWLTKNLYLSLMMQLTPFLSIAILPGMTYVGPESLLVVISIGFATTVLVFLEGRTEKRYTFFAVLFGILSGIAIATKLSALPLMIVPLVLLSGRYKLLCSMITGIAFLGATLPVLPRYRYFIGWIYGIATHTGRHGTGDKGLIDPTKYLKDLYWLALEEKFFSVILLVSMLVLAWWFLTHRSLPLSQSSKDLPKSLLAISLAELLQLLIVAKHPAVHYLVPALGLLGLNLILISKLIAPMTVKRSHLAHAVIFLIVLSSTMTIQLPNVRAVHESFADSKLGQQSVFEKVQENYKGCKIISYYGASSLPAAWLLGSWGGAGTFSQRLQELYPDALFYTDRVINFVRSVDFKQIAADDSCVLFDGRDPSSVTYNIRMPPNVNLEKVYSRSREALYRVKNMG